MPVKSIKIESAASRIVLAVLALICVAAAFTFTKWSLANAVSVQADFKEVAALAAATAPDDPQTHLISAILLEKTFLPEDLQKSLDEYEKAAALSPNNYLYWLSLGSARERAGDAAGAEKALRKAFELAPNYSQVQWSLGNTLLRQGNAEESLSMIRRAIQSDPTLTNAAIVAAWQIFDGEIPQIKQAIGNSDEANAALALFLARQQRFDEAFETWSALPADLKSGALKRTGEELANQFISAKKYRSAQSVSAGISADESKKTSLEKITNGDFENDIKMQNAGFFEWQITDGAQPQIGLDSQVRRGGARSLLMIYNSTDGKNFRQISQTVTVQPEKSYQLALAFKSELKTSVGLKWEIVDASDGKLLGASPVVSGASDWTNVSVPFSTAKTAEAVIVRLVRDACPAGICPVSGKIWFDDFNLSANNR
ncbi:MAG: protein O-GlcNAc transferase [Acidobacteria bacterium]|nr:protein O-GlcNAc transferase [Acidobacteriota bacterium]